MHRSVTAFTPILFAVSALLPQASGCRTGAVRDDFRIPYERRDVLLPGASYVLRIHGRQRETVDIALDYETNPKAEEKTPDVELIVVDGKSFEFVGRPVKGAGMKQAVCGVTIEPGSDVHVVVENRKLTRSIPFALRIERSPSPICAPYTLVPSLVLVDSSLRRPAR